MARTQLDEIRQQRDAHEARVQHVHDEHQRLQHKHSTLQLDYAVLQQTVAMEDDARQTIARLEAELHAARVQQQTAVRDAQASDVSQHLARRAIEQATAECLREFNVMGMLSAVDSCTGNAIAPSRVLRDAPESDDAGDGRASFESWGSWDEDDRCETEATAMAEATTIASPGGVALDTTLGTRVADALSAMAESVSYTVSALLIPQLHRGDACYSKDHFYERFREWKGL